MAWLFKFINSSIGKKILMALTGFLLCGFLITHLLGNLLLFSGEDAFNDYVQKLKSLGILLKIAEVGLASLFLAHIANGIKLTLENRDSKNIANEINDASANSTVASRTMPYTGGIVLIFLILHLYHFWFRFNVVETGMSYYEIVLSAEYGFGNSILSAFYILCMGLLAFHLRHGFQSAFRSLGLNNEKYMPIIQLVGVFFWFIIPVGFASIPFYFGFIAGGQ